MKKLPTLQCYEYSLVQGTLHDSWLQKTRLHAFASLPWGPASANPLAQEQLSHLLQRDALPLKSNRKVMLHPSILAEALLLPNDGITVAPELQDSDMAIIFGAKPPKESQFRLVTMQDHILRNRYEWFVEKVTLLVKSAYMSKKAYALLHKAEQGEPVNWAQICCNMLVTRLNSLKKSGGRIKLSAHLHFLFQYSLARDKGPEGTITLKAEEALDVVPGACNSTSSNSLILLSEEDWKGDADSDVSLPSLRPTCIMNSSNKLNAEEPSVVREKHMEKIWRRSMGTMPNPKTSHHMHPHEKDVATLGPTFMDTNSVPENASQPCLKNSFKWLEKNIVNHSIDSFDWLEEATMDQAPPIYNFNWLDETTEVTTTNQAPSKERLHSKNAKANKSTRTEQLRKVGRDLVSTALQELKDPESLGEKGQENFKLESCKLDVVEQIHKQRNQSRMPSFPVSDLKSEREIMQKTLQSQVDYTPQQLQQASLIVADWVAKGSNKLLDVEQKCVDLSDTLCKKQAECKALEQKFEALLERVQCLSKVKKEIIQQKQQQIDEVVESKVSEIKQLLDSVRNEKETYAKDTQNAFKKDLLHAKSEAEKAIIGLKTHLADKKMELQSKWGTEKGMLAIHPQKLKQYEAYILAQVTKIWQNQIDQLVSAHASHEQA